MEELITRVPEIKEDLVEEPLLAPCFLSDVATGITPHEHKGKGIPYNTALRHELKLLGPILFWI